MWKSRSVRWPFFCRRREDGCPSIPIIDVENDGYVPRTERMKKWDSVSYMLCSYVTHLSQPEIPSMVSKHSIRDIILQWQTITTIEIYRFFGTRRVLVGRKHKESTKPVGYEVKSKLISSTHVHTIQVTSFPHTKTLQPADCNMWESQAKRPPYVLDKDPLFTFTPTKNTMSSSMIGSSATRITTKQIPTA